jgi:hypothetical protein
MRLGAAIAPFYKYAWRYQKDELFLLKRLFISSAPPSTSSSEHRNIYSAYTGGQWRTALLNRAHA